jgi:hypothetical protein
LKLKEKVKIMGNKKFNLTKLALAMGVTLSLSGCFSDNDNNVEIKPPVPVPEEKITVPVSDTPAALNFFVNTTFLDAAKDDGTLVSNVTVKFFDAEGNPSQSIANLAGEAKSEFTVTDGSVNFKLVENADINSVVMIASAEGYFDNRVDVDLSAKDDVINTVVSLAKTDALVVASKSGTASAGKLTADLTASASDTAAAASASVEIPTGVELRNSENQLIESATDITMSVVTAGFVAVEGKVSAAKVIPQGLQEKAGLDADSTAEPLAFVEVKVNAGDTPVKRFNPGLNITTKIAGTFEGTETFDLMSYDETTGVWSKEDSKATFVDGSKDTVKFTVDHLSSFVPTRPAKRCNEEVSYAFSGANIPSSGLILAVSNPTLQWVSVAKSNSGVLFNKTLVRAAGIKESEKAFVQVFDFNGNEWGSASDVSLCTTGTDINIPLEPAVTYVNQSFALTYTCSNTDQPDKQLPFTGALVRFGQAGKAPLIARETNGTYALPGLVSGATYQLSVLPVGVDVGDASLAVPNFTATDGQNPSFNIIRSNCQTEQQTVTGTGSGS